MNTITPVRTAVAVLLLPLVAGLAGVAAEPPPEAPEVETETAAENPEVARLLAALGKLEPRTGAIALGENLATLNVPDNLRYLDARSTHVVLEELWRNPPDEDALGMLIPDDPRQLLGDDAWAVVLTYENDGHIKDDDAAGLDYDELLTSMQQQTRQANAAREKAGYPAIELVGWAVPPSYDPAGKKLYWAKRLHFAGSPADTLNYGIRVLGRSGVLVLNVVGGMEQLEDIQAKAPALLASVDFNPGSRYADFNPATDHVAEYGIAALIAGGVLAKTGLIKALWVGILAFKKFIIVGLIAAGAVVKRFFGRRKSAFTATPPAA